VAGNDTRRLIAAALHGLGQIYRPGYRYKKPGSASPGFDRQQPRRATCFPAMNGSVPNA